MKPRTVFVIAMFLLCMSSAEAESSVAAKWEENYKGWGWEKVLVLDNGLIRVISQTQTLPVPKWNGKQDRFVHPEGPLSKLKMERVMTIFTGSSRVRVQQTLINVGDISVRQGFKGVSPSRVRHGEERDYENFWCYFPLNLNSVMDHSGVRYTGNGSRAAV